MSAERAVRRIWDLMDGSHAEPASEWLRTVALWPNATGFLSRVATAIDRATLLDYLAELRYALMFRGLGFALQFEPCGPEGPDLGICRSGLSATVEVARFRPMNPGPSVITDDFADGVLEVYGNPERDTAKAIAKVRHKFRQAAGDRFIIALWNDDDAMEGVEVSCAVANLAHHPERPAALQFVLYGSQWIGTRQLHCFPVAQDPEERVREWMHELEVARVSVAVATGLVIQQEKGCRTRA
jgi:hypothetical protein